MFLLVPAYPGCPGSKAVKRSLLLLLLLLFGVVEKGLSDAAAKQGARKTKLQFLGYCAALFA